MKALRAAAIVAASGAFSRDPAAKAWAWQVGQFAVCMCGLKALQTWPVGLAVGPDAALAGLLLVLAAAAATAPPAPCRPLDRDVTDSLKGLLQLVSLAGLYCDRSTAVSGPVSFCFIVLAGACHSKGPGPVSLDHAGALMRRYGALPLILLILAKGADHERYVAVAFTLFWSLAALALQKQKWGPHTVHGILAACAVLGLAVPQTFALPWAIGVGLAAHEERLPAALALPKTPLVALGRCSLEIFVLRGWFSPLLLVPHWPLVNAALSASLLCATALWLRAQLRAQQRLPGVHLLAAVMLVVIEAFPLSPHAYFPGLQVAGMAISGFFFASPLFGVGKGSLPLLLGLVLLELAVSSSSIALLPTASEIDCARPLQLGSYGPGGQGWQWPEAHAAACGFPDPDSPEDFARLLGDRRLVFAGDSNTRETFLLLAERLTGERPEVSKSASEPFEAGPLTYYPLRTAEALAGLATAHEADDVVVVGVTLWDALHSRDVERFKRELPVLPFSHVVYQTAVTTVPDKVSTEEKREFMSPGKVAPFTAALLEHAGPGAAVVDMGALTEGRRAHTRDGVHYGEQEYGAALAVLFALLPRP